MFLSNNGPSFHLWWKENLVKHREVSKYYETDCSLLGNLLTGKGSLRAGSGKKKGKGILRAGSGI